MASIICPECKNHVSEYDLACLICGHTITEEEREKLIKEFVKREENDLVTKRT